MRYVFIVNPRAGNGKTAQKLVPEIEAYFREAGGAYRVYFTEYPRHAASLARAEASMGGSVRIYACGGDGTIFEVLGGIIGYENVELGAFPCGTANDFLRWFRCGADFLSVEKQVRGSSVPIDIIRAGEQYAANLCAAGLEAETAAAFSHLRDMAVIGGKNAYRLSMVYSLWNLTGREMEIIMDSSPPVRGEFLGALAANGPCFGGIYTAAPRAVLNDGVLEFNLIASPSRRQLASFLSACRRGEAFENHPACRHFRGKSMKISCGEEIPVCMDGEVFRCREITFEVMPHAVKFLIPGVCTEKWEQAGAKHASGPIRSVPCS